MGVGVWTTPRRDALRQWHATQQQVHHPFGEGSISVPAGFGTIAFLLNAPFRTQGVLRHYPKTRPPPLLPDEDPGAPHLPMATIGCDLPKREEFPHPPHLSNCWDSSEPPPKRQLPYPILFKIPLRNQNTRGSPKSEAERTTREKGVEPPRPCAADKNRVLSE